MFSRYLFHLAVHLNSDFIYCNSLVLTVNITAGEYDFLSTTANAGCVSSLSQAFIKLKFKSQYKICFTIFDGN